MGSLKTQKEIYKDSIIFFIFVFLMIIIAISVNTNTLRIKAGIGAIINSIQHNIPHIRYILVLTGAFAFLVLLFLYTASGTKMMHQFILTNKYKREIDASGEEVKPAKSTEEAKEQLRAYIEKSRSWHYPRIRIKTALLKIGWKEEIIDEAMKKVYDNPNRKLYI